MEGEKVRVKRQLPRVPNSKGNEKSSRKTRSAGSISSSSKDAIKKTSYSSLLEAGERLSLSPPGTKPRVFMGYSIADSTTEGEDSSVTVAVRVRPFSEREIQLGAKQIIKMQDHETIITSRDGISKHHFCYDQCFWSFDDVTAPFADQKTVYTNLAQPLLDKAFQGYNTCLFAYGQTGSGKSYCIMGETNALGVIPQFARELYERIEGTTDTETSYKLEVSYYEIYKERIHDLLASTKQKSRVHLRVREHPVMGPYVEDLSTYVASSFNDIEQWLALGNRFRATAATGMNDRSSRSHSVFTLLLTQTTVIEGEDHSRVSRINLIDLAGSERSAVSQTSGERLKEGASINKSLHTLGKVISLLSEKSTGKRKKVYIPYRDSTLTWLLKESLGGNSKTAMIATISPADLHYDESLSTLRYAQQARSIINIARINEDPSSRLIRDLRQEIEWLRSQLGDGVTGMADILQGQEEVRQLKEKLNEYEKLMKEMSRSWEERLKRTEERKMEEAEQLKRAGVSFKVDNRLPNLVNLNEDPQLSEMLLYVIKEGDTAVGRHAQCDIQLTGALVMKDHCIIHNMQDVVTVEPSTDLEAQTFINGTAITSSTVLHHGDRVVIAGEHFFRFNHPLEVERNASLRKGSQGTSKGFEFARDEYIKAQTARLEAERIQERQEMMKELEAFKIAAEQRMDQQKVTYEDKLRLLEGTLVSKSSEVTEREQQKLEAEERISELERINKELEEETIAQRHIIELEKMKTQKEYDEMAHERSRLMQELEQEKCKLEGDIDMLQKSKMNREKQRETSNDISTSSADFIQGSELLRIATMLQEANVISKNLGKPFNFSREDNFDENEVSMKVRVTDTQLNKVTFWDLDKFESRLEHMREIYQHHGSFTSLDADQFESEWAGLVGDSDPFHDPHDVWLEDSFLSSYSPLSSVEGRRQSLAQLVASPLSSNKGTPHKSLLDLIPSIPKRLLQSSLSSSPGLTYSPTSPSYTPQHKSPKKSIDMIIQLCHDKMSTMLQYKHKQSSGLLENFLNHVFKLQSIAQSFDEPTTVEQEVKVLELYTTLELLLASSKTLEVVVLSNEGKEIRIKGCSSRECCQQLIEDIAHQTALYCSKMLQALLTGSHSDMTDACSNLLESLQGLIKTFGQLVLAIEVQYMSQNGEKPDSLVLPDLQADELSFIQYGYHSWCSLFMETILSSLHHLLEKLQELNSPNYQSLLITLRQVISTALQLLHQTSDFEELFWHPAEVATTPSSTSLQFPSLDSIIAILAKMYTVYISLDILCNTGLNINISDNSESWMKSLSTCNNDLAHSAEELAVSIISFLHNFSYNEATQEVQALARNIAMATRSFKQLLKQGNTVIASTPYGGDETPETSTDSMSIPPQFLLPSPSPPPSPSDELSDADTYLS